MFSAFNFVALVPMFLMLLFYGFILYFLFKVLDFMKNKTEQDKVLSQKVDRLIDVLEKKNQ